jgi:hypothetical protein
MDKVRSTDLNKNTTAHKKEKEKKEGDERGKSGGGKEKSPSLLS